MKNYSYKVVGVTFPARDGSDRQKTLKALFKEDMELGNSFHIITLEGYEFEGDDALAVLLDGKEIGNIPADKVQDVAEIGQKADDCTVTLTLNGRDFQEAKDIIELYKDRKEMVKDGTLHELDLDRVEEDYHELMSGEQIYGAVLHFLIMTEEEKQERQRMQERVQELKKMEAEAKKKEPVRPLFVFLMVFTGMIGFVLGIGTIAESFNPKILIPFLIFAGGFILSLKNLRRPKK